MRLYKNQLVEKYNINVRTLNKYINKVGIGNYRKVNQEQYNALMLLLEQNKKDKMLMQSFNANLVESTNIDDTTQPKRYHQIVFNPTDKSTGARLLKQRENYNELLALKDLYKKALDYALVNNANINIIQCYNNLFLGVCKQLESKEKVINMLEEVKSLCGYWSTGKHLEDDYLNAVQKEYDEEYGYGKEESQEEETEEVEDEELAEDEEIEEIEEESQEDSKEYTDEEIEERIKEELKTFSDEQLVSLSVTLQNPQIYKEYVDLLLDNGFPADYINAFFEYFKKNKHKYTKV